MKKKSFKESIFDILRLYSSISFPFLVCLAVIILNDSLIRVENFQILAPYFIYAILYYYLVKRPEVLSCFYILVLGIVKDIVDLDILGMNALMFLIFWGVVTSQNKYITKDKPFIVIWAGFLFSLIIISVFSFLLKYLMVNIFVQPMHIVFLRLFITVCFYVPIHWLLDKFE